MSMFTLQGTIFQIGDTQQKTDRFKVRDIVIKTGDSNYPQFVTFQGKNRVCDFMDNLAVGSTVDVEFTVEGRQWKDRFFNTLGIIKIITLADPDNVDENANENPAGPVGGGSFVEGGGDLPF